MNNDVIVINTDELSPPQYDGQLISNRAASYFQYDLQGVPKCSIMVLGYNRIHKTKYAVECVLKYTTDIDYELILVDNGSTDDTLEFFKSVEHPNKVIIHITKNINTSFPLRIARNVFKGKYLVVVSNDVYVTQNWLSNLLKCYESDPAIGFVNPVSSNVSNLQQVDLGFSNFDEMQIKAAEFNKSDTSKWEERLRLISILQIYSRELIDNVGLFDTAFVHDFAEDDYAIRVRRAGYKLLLCNDTWVCHDHDFRNLEDKDPIAFISSLDSGRALYKEKYRGIDAWDDINNFEHMLLTPIAQLTLPDDPLRVLCIDVKCGTPILEIRNILRKRGRTDVSNFAFTTDAKYYLDLQTTGSEIICDRIDFINYKEASFDIIAIGNPINCYTNPKLLLENVYRYLKNDGLLLFKLRNTNDYKALTKAIGVSNNSDNDNPILMTVEEVDEIIKSYGGKEIGVSSEQYPLSQNDINLLKDWIGKINPNYTQMNLQTLATRDYVFRVIKG